MASSHNNNNNNTEAGAGGLVFEDFFPAMVEKLGADGFMEELCNGFKLLKDADKGVITFQSLKANSQLLGMPDMTDDVVKCMLREADLDGDGVLNQMEFCVLMCRLSPGLMDASMDWLLQQASSSSY